MKKQLLLLLCILIFLSCNKESELTNLGKNVLNSEQSINSFIRGGLKVSGSETIFGVSTNLKRHISNADLPTSCYRKALKITFGRPTFFNRGGNGYMTAESDIGGTWEGAKVILEHHPYGGIIWRQAQQWEMYPYDGDNLEGKNGGWKFNLKNKVGWGKTRTLSMGSRTTKLGQGKLYQYPEVEEKDLEFLILECHYDKNPRGYLIHVASNRLVKVTLPTSSSDKAKVVLGEIYNPNRCFSADYWWEATLDTWD